MNYTWPITPEQWEEATRHLRHVEAVLAAWQADAYVGIRWPDVLIGPETGLVSEHGKFVLKTDTGATRGEWTSGGLYLYQAGTWTVALKNDGTFALRSASSGARVVIDTTGIRLYNAAGILTVELDAATGSAMFTGTLHSGAGDIGGWGITASTIEKNDAVLASAGYLRLGTGNDIIKLSAIDPLYRLWVGNADPTFAPFRVSKAGELYATGATISGTITATSGSIGGWDITASTIEKNNAILASAGYLRLGTGNNIVELNAADLTYRLWVGNAVAASAPFSVTKAGNIKARAGEVAGWTLGWSEDTGGWLEGTNTFLFASGILVLGSGANVIYLDALHATYRLWVGNATPTSAPFRVSKTGEVWASTVHLLQSLQGYYDDTGWYLEQARNINWKDSLGNYSFVIGVYLDDLYFWANPSTGADGEIKLWSYDGIEFSAVYDGIRRMTGYFGIAYLDLYTTHGLTLTNCVNKHIVLDANDYLRWDDVGNSLRLFVGGGLQFVIDATGAITTGTIPWGSVTSKPSEFNPSAHALVSAYHTASGLTTGQVLQATGATTFGFGNCIRLGDVTLVGANRALMFDTDDYLRYNAASNYFTLLIGGVEKFRFASDGSIAVGTIPWGSVTSKPAEFNPTAHALVSAYHTASGLTVNYVPKATGAATFAWGRLPSGGLAFGGCGLRLSEDKSIATGTWTIVDWDAEEYDTLDMGDVTNNRINILTSGYYLVTFNFAFNALTATRVACVVGNSDWTRCIVTESHAEGGAWRTSGAEIWHLASDNYVQMMVYQNSGGAITIRADTCYLGAMFVGV